jgi:hypothetical protein
MRLKKVKKIQIKILFIKLIRKIKMKFTWTKIMAVIGLVVGISSSYNYGVQVIAEHVGFSLPYIIFFSLAGLFFDLIGYKFGKKND